MTTNKITKKTARAKLAAAEFNLNAVDFCLAHAQAAGADTAVYEAKYALAESEYRKALDLCKSVGA